MFAKKIQIPLDKFIKDPDAKLIANEIEREDLSKAFANLRRVLEFINFRQTGKYSRISTQKSYIQQGVTSS